MIPIAKNVIVVDEQGNEYEATYPKRAKGLVKSGRARFIAYNKICLARPPNIFLEDALQMDKIKDFGKNIAETVTNSMNDIIYNASAQNENQDFEFSNKNGSGYHPGSSQYTERHERSNRPEPMKNRPRTNEDHKHSNGQNTYDPLVKLDVVQILSRIDKIIDDNTYIHESIGAVSNMEPLLPSTDDNAESARSEAIATIVKCRETTNQQILKLLEKVYDDIKPVKPIDPTVIRKFDFLSEIMMEMDTDSTQFASAFQKVLDSIF